MGSSGVRMGVGVGVGMVWDMWTCGHRSHPQNMCPVLVWCWGVWRCCRWVLCWGVGKMVANGRSEPSHGCSWCGVLVWSLPHVGRCCRGCCEVWQCGMNIANRHGYGVAPSWHGTGGGGVGHGALSGANTPFSKKKKKRKSQKTEKINFKAF